MPEPTTPAHRHPASTPALAATLLAVIALALSACGHRYVTPGGPADFRALGIAPQAATDLTDPAIRVRLDRMPLAAFPANLAVVRVQDWRYRGYGDQTANSIGRVSVVVSRDPKAAEQLAQLREIPGIRGVAPLNALVLPSAVNSEADLRGAAASVQADLLLMYTIDTQFEVDNRLPTLSVLSLGLIPDNNARVVSTASAALIDTRNGYVYGLAESTTSASRIANGWGTEAAVDASRREAEAEAVKTLITEVRSLLTDVIARYGPPSTPAPAASPAPAANPAPAG